MWMNAVEQAGTNVNINQDVETRKAATDVLVRLAITWGEMEEAVMVSASSQYSKSLQASSCTLLNSFQNIFGRKYH